MINCTFEHGNEAHLRHTVVDIVVVKDEELLLVKRSPKLLEGGKWALPGGFMELGETAAEAARRELLEETGWTARDFLPLMVNTEPDRPGEDRQNVSIVFVCTPDEKTGEADWESTQVKWFPLALLPPAADLAFDHTRYVDLYLKSRKERIITPLVV